MTVETILERFSTKTGCLDSQSSQLKIVAAVPSVCCKNPVFLTSKSVSKTIKCYYVIL